MRSARLRRRLAASGFVALLMATLTVYVGTPDAVAAVGAGSVKVAIDDVSPNSPTLSDGHPQKLAISLTLTNTTGQTLKDVTVSAARANPITSQDLLDKAIAKPSAPDPVLVAPLSPKLKATLAPHATSHLVYRTTTDIDSGQLCLCANAIYPLYFTADYLDAATGVDVQLGAAQTYLPSFKTKQPVKARVGWLWPLLDRPHRLTSDTVFTDDDLAGEVAVGGRLDRMLDVVEGAAKRSVPLTIVTDPDLIDELAVMSGVNTTGYEVKTGAGPAIPGDGGDAAKAWLARLDAVLLAYPKVEVAFTPVADPAVESLTRSGLSWTVGLDTRAQARVTKALDGQTPLTDIAWPAGGTLSKSTLATLATQGTKTVVVSDKTLTGGSTQAVVPDALAPVQTGNGETTAAVTSTSIERWVSSVLEPTSAGGKGLAALPELVSEVAIRVENSLERSHYILITPPRNLDIADPDVAVRAIVATSQTPWSSPLPLRAAAASITPVSHGPLRSGHAPGLPSTTLDALHYVTRSVRELASLYVQPAVAAARLDYFPLAVQRCESTSLLGSAELSNACANRLETLIKSGILAKVVLVQPHSGSNDGAGTYTFTSQNSKLPITVVNKLPDDVTVQVNVFASGGPGFTAQPLNVRIRGDSKVQLHVSTHVDHPGRFNVQATLSTTNGIPLGTGIELTVRSTALGTIGVVITIAAAVVLALALLTRFVRRFSRSRRRTSPKASDGAAQRVVATAAR